MKEKPCYKLPEENTGAINGLIHATTAIYNDRENRFRNQIAKNHLQSFMLDIYDKCYRHFDRREIEGEAGRMKSSRISSHWYTKTVSRNGK